MTNNRLNLEESCNECNGSGVSEYEECLNCHGTGMAPTENGEQILVFVQRHLKSFLRNAE